MASAGGPDVGALFMAVDTDKSGQISWQELQTALSNGGYQKFATRTCKLLIRLFDTDRSGEIGYHEFAQLWGYLGSWSSYFQAHDTDRSGTISFPEFKTCVASLGYRLSDATLGAMMMSYDADRTGNLGFDEYLQAMSELTLFTNLFRTHDTSSTGVVTISYEQFLGMVLSARVL
ncbi:hypothetical protein FNF27_02294 [Cafeteria roenbergensis]|nr:hypothetical protein FNF28_04220 [Cafeteria roenbergensis]KAA0168072.1 hypothetical protein FNF31_00571 [Cafeteria roenbergensis]KAA0176237.1 hypothetical protein FNF27_02294 [Cafeteria roenbergensis]